MAALVLGGCAGQSTGDNDPLESVNRRVFAFNHSLDAHAALPAASYYKSAVPNGVRDGLHNFLVNLSEPVSFANDLLQGQMTRAGISVCRFGINTTAGVAGIMDPATDWGRPAYHPQDFGLTLGDYGVPGGPYLVLPLIGSTMPRDAAGKILVDHFFSPLGYVTYHGKLYISLGRTLVTTIDQKAHALDELRASSVIRSTTMRPCAGSIDSAARPTSATTWMPRLRNHRIALFFRAV